MRNGTIAADTRTPSEILVEARDLQASHAAPALLSLLRGAVRILGGARRPLGAGQLILH